MEVKQSFIFFFSSFLPQQSTNSTSYITRDGAGFGEAGFSREVSGDGGGCSTVGVRNMFSVCLSFVLFAFCVICRAQNANVCLGEEKRQGLLAGDFNLGGHCPKYQQKQRLIIDLNSYSRGSTLNCIVGIASVAFSCK